MLAICGRGILGGDVLIDLIQIEEGASREFDDQV